MGIGPHPENRSPPRKLLWSGQRIQLVLQVRLRIGDSNAWFCSVVFSIKRPAMPSPKIPINTRRKGKRARRAAGSATA
jgi:hypothetical protein